MIGEADHDALAKHPRDGVLGRLAGDLIGNPEDVFERHSPPPLRASSPSASRPPGSGT